MRFKANTDAGERLALVWMGKPALISSWGGGYAPSSPEFHLSWAYSKEIKGNNYLNVVPVISNSVKVLPCCWPGTCDCNTRERAAVSWNGDPPTLLSKKQNKRSFCFIVFAGFNFLATAGQSGGPSSPITDVPPALNQRHRQVNSPAEIVFLCVCVAFFFHLN